MECHNAAGTTRARTIHEILEYLSASGKTAKGGDKLCDTFIHKISETARKLVNNGAVTIDSVARVLEQDHPTSLCRFIFVQNV